MEPVAVAEKKKLKRPSQSKRKQLRRLKQEARNENVSEAEFARRTRQA